MERAFVERMARELVANPVWQVRALKSVWVCPYCADPGAKGNAIEDLLPLVQRHLQNCPGWKQFQGKPLTLAALRHKAILLELANHLSTQNVWRVVAPNSYWICPFCVKITDVRFPKGAAKVDVSILQGILAHLNGCAPYDSGKGLLKTLDEIKLSVSGMLEQKRFLSEIRQNLTKSEIWRVKDRNECWVCPYCRQSIAGIVISSQFLIMESAPALISRHLKERCLPYRNGAKPATQVEELTVPEQPVADEKSALAHAAETASTDWIRTELQEMKSKMEVSKDITRGIEEARKKQLEMLPQAPKVAGFDFACMYKPCTSLGGDFYDFVHVSPHEVGVAIGDVSGHGIEAAIVMSMVKKLLNVHGRGKSYAGATLRSTNRDIYEDLDTRTFITVLYGVLNTQKKTFNFVRAGHTMPILYNPARNPDLQVLGSNGMVIGVDRGTSFDAVLEEREIDLRPGDVIVVYTDGLSETMNPAGEILGEERIAEAVRQYGKYDMEYLLHRLDLMAAEYRREAAQGDDIAVVGIKVNGA